MVAGWHLVWKSGLLQLKFGGIGVGMAASFSLILLQLKFGGIGVGMASSFSLILLKFVLHGDLV